MTRQKLLWMRRCAVVAALIGLAGGGVVDPVRSTEAGSRSELGSPRPVERVTARYPTVNSSGEKTQRVSCPAGSVALSGGVRVVSGTASVALSESRISVDAAGWIGVAHELGRGTRRRWTIEVFALCSPRRHSPGRTTPATP